MTTQLEESLRLLTENQRRAAEWDSGSVLVLAGPGSGKTRVLTTRIGRILDQSRDETFRLLALTFTNRAADEMRRRVEQLVDKHHDRVFIGTFHSFCAQQLRQHGSHIGIDPDYGVYSTREDREALLRDALRKAAKNGESVTIDDVSMLSRIDDVRSHLTEPEDLVATPESPEIPSRFARIYSIYEQTLRENNVLDFESMIFKTWKLALNWPKFCMRIRRVYKYWLVDEFQDMSSSQYEILRLLAGGKFDNLFAVADEDQLIYSWRGASRDGLNRFRSDFGAKTIYFEENFRCPPDVVDAANRLIERNAQRDRARGRSIAQKTGARSSIRLSRYEDERQEAVAVAQYFQSLNSQQREQGGVLARKRSSLVDLHQVFNARGVESVIMKGIREFTSPQFRWLECCLDLAIRPHDKQRLRHLTVEANRFASALSLNPDDLMAEAEASRESHLEVWARAAGRVCDPLAGQLSRTARNLLEARREWRSIMAESISYLKQSEPTGEGAIGDAEEDCTLWAEDSQHILAEHGESIDLPAFMQSMAIRSRNQRVASGTVRLTTIHGAKGLEFDRVWVIGLAESIIPSFQAIQENSSEGIEEERRNLFVAITRTKSELTLSYPKRENGWPREPSRFLMEMFGRPPVSRRDGLTDGP